jgi:uncharacterized protein
MDLSLERSEGLRLVRRVGASAIALTDGERSSSFLLLPGNEVENWPVTSAATLGEEDGNALQERRPELVILGTGHTQIFPGPVFMAALLQRQIGLEVMNNAAAARTYNLLAGEGRRVIGAFILPAG